MQSYIHTYNHAYGKLFAKACAATICLNILHMSTKNPLPEIAVTCVCLSKKLAAGFTPI